MYININSVLVNDMNTQTVATFPDRVVSPLFDLFVLLFRIQHAWHCLRPRSLGLRCTPCAVQDTYIPGTKKTGTKKGRLRMTGKYEIQESLR